MEIIKPHKNISRPVITREEIEMIPNIALKMDNLMFELLREKKFKKIFAIAHPQVEKDNPLRFFMLCRYNQQIVDNDRYGFRSYIIINPIITRHSNYANKLTEGCLSFQKEGDVKIDRWHKIEVNYQTIDHENKGGLLENRISLSGIPAEIVQHEIDHFDCRYIHKI